MRLWPFAGAPCAADWRWVRRTRSAASCGRGPVLVRSVPERPAKTDRSKSKYVRLGVADSPTRASPVVFARLPSRESVEASGRAGRARRQRCLSPIANRVCCGRSTVSPAAGARLGGLMAQGWKNPPIPGGTTTTLAPPFPTERDKQTGSRRRRSKEGSRSGKNKQTRMCMYVLVNAMIQRRG